MHREPISERAATSTNTGSLSARVLAEPNVAFQATDGVSGENAAQAFRPAFTDHTQGTAYLSRFTNMTRLERLFHSLSADVYRYAFWLCRDRNMAEDLVQETFVRASESIDNLNDENAAKSWLFTIVRREHARQYQRKRLDIVDDVDFGGVEGRKDYDASADAFVLRRALAVLPTEYRKPLILHVIGGFSGEEIAEKLGLTRGAVMTRLFRARNKLQEMLEGDEDIIPATGVT